MKRRLLFSLAVFLLACSSETGSGGDEADTSPSGDSDVDGDTDVDSDADGDTDGDSDTDSDSDGDSDDVPEMRPELWYSADEFLVRIELSAENGSVVGLTASEFTGLHLGQNCITMLDDGSLVGARLSDVDKLTRFYHIEKPPLDGGQAVAVDLGLMPDEIMLEGLYTDCDGRLYGMDTGADVGSSQGNRLLRFTGDYLGGDFGYEVISDLSSAVVADIDDMGPGIDEIGEVTDNPGLAIDTGTIYDFDYVTGTGTQVAQGGSWGIHALGGQLFDDGVSRVYLLSSAAQLFELNPSTYEVSEVLVTGPATSNGYHGWSGLAGPLTDCETGFDPPVK